MIKPVVGRQVWFFQFTSGQHVGPFAATIACVNNDQYVNIGALDLQGSPFAQTSVKLLQAGDGIPSSDYCTWTPHQFAMESNPPQPGQPTQYG